MVSTDTKMYNVNKLNAAFNTTKTLSQGVKLTPIVTVKNVLPAGQTLYTSAPKVTVLKPLEIIKMAQTAKAKNDALKSAPKGIDQIIGGIVGVILGQALQNPLLSSDTNKKILIQSTAQGLSGGVGKVAAVIPAGLGGTVGYAIGGTSGITQGVIKGPVNTIINTIQKEYIERIVTVKEGIEGGIDIFKGAGDFLNKYGLWIALGVGAIILLPSITSIFRSRD